MAVKIIEEEQRKKINMLKNVDAEFVSLVKHGANRMPFRVVKMDKQRGGEETEMTLAIQSIILPKGRQIEDLTKIEGLQYLSEADLSQKQDFDEYVKFPQVDPKLFDSGSMQLVKAGDGFLIVGLMKEKIDKQVLSLSQEQVEKIAALPTAPMDAVIGDPDVAAQQAMVTSFREMFDRELYSMIDVVTGVLRQVASDPKKRKNAILTAVDAFKNFLSVGLDAIGGNDAGVSKFEKTESDGNSFGGDEMFKTKEEFTNAVNEIVNKSLDEKLPTMVGESVTAALEKFESKLDERLKAQPAATDDTDPSGTTDGGDGKQTDKSAKTDKDEDDPVAKLAETVSSLSEKVEKLINDPATDSGAASQDDPGASADKKKTDDDRKKVTADHKYKGREREHDMSVFGGLLTRKRKNAA